MEFGDSDGRKGKVHLCALQGKKVVCSGLCHVVFDDDRIYICPIRERAVDEVLNCR